MLKRFQVQKKDHVSHASDAISFLSFMKTHKTACDSNRISEGAAMWLVHYFMKKLWPAAFYSRLQLRSSRSSKLNRKDGSLFAYADIVKYLLENLSNG